MLFLILDKDFCTERDPLDIALAAIDGGTSMLQLRWKTNDLESFSTWARSFLPLLKQFNNKVEFFINDYIEVAKELGMNCWIGQNDINYNDARNMIGSDLKLGLSCSNISPSSNEYVRHAIENSIVDYVSFGPVFKTPVKDKEPIGIERFNKMSKDAKNLNPAIKTVSVGGIGIEDNMILAEEKNQKLHCDYFAVLRTVCTSTDPKLRVQQLIKSLKGETENEL